MCGLCGLLGVDHWTDMAANPQAFGGAGRTRRHERIYRARLASQVLARFGLTLEDWQGRSFVLSSRTGKRKLVDDAAQLWLEAETMAGRPLDPLDPALLDALEREGGSLGQD